MKFRVLGSVAVHDSSGESNTLQALKLRRLLALLLINKGKEVTTEVLIDQLWDSSPPKSARTALQVYVSRIRSRLGRHFGEQKARNTLMTFPSGYGLELRGHEFDLLQFEELSVKSRTAETQGKLEEARALLGKALAVWTGPALADVQGVTFLDRSAKRLDEIQLTAQGRYISLGLALGHHADLIGDIEELVSRHPFREDFCGHLMVALYRSGRIAESLMVYQRIRNSLVKEIGMEPGPYLQRLHHLALNHDLGQEELL